MGRGIGKFVPFVHHLMSEPDELSEMMQLVHIASTETNTAPRE